MFIQTETTPNPQTLKLLPGVPVLEEGTLFFTDAESAKKSPLAQKLFAISGINAVFFGSDFITVTKGETQEWNTLKPALLTTVMEFFVSGQSVVKPASSAQASDSEDSEIVQQIKELLETRVRPAVAQDGGDIVFHGFEDGIVKLEMHGSCAGCPSSTATLKQGIESMLKHYVPEVIAVEAVA